MGILRNDITTLKPDDVAIIGIPFDEHGSFLKGPAKAPELIINALESDSANFFTEQLTNLDKHPKISWLGNAEFQDYLSIEQSISGILDRGSIPVSLGGDHSISYPILKAINAHYGQVNILHFDAHTDLYDELNNNKYSHACPFARIMEDELASSLTQVGIRTLTEHTKEQADKFGVEIIQMKDWNEGRQFQIKGPVYLSFDIDVLDPSFAPGGSHHEPGGFSTREVLSIIQSLDLDIVGLDLVEYNPDRDVNGVTAMVAAKILKELVDKLI